MLANLGLRPDLGHNGARQSRPSSRSWPQWSSSISATVLAWVWWLFRWQWWSCSGIFVGFWAEVHVMKKCFWSAGWWWLDCVSHWWWDLGLIVLIWVCCDWFLDLDLIWVGLLTGFMDLICWEFGVDCVRFDDVGFDDLWGVEFGFFLLVFIYVLVIWVWVIRLLGLCSCDGFEFLVAGYDLEKEWRTSCKMKNNLNSC